MGPDKKVYLTLGDINGRETIPQSKAQNIKNGSLHEGSSGILRFTQVGKPAGWWWLTCHIFQSYNKYYAYSIRNNFGIDYDPFIGNIWITYNGPWYGNEPNFCDAGI